MELTIEQALQQGIAAHKEGKLQDAERLYRAILQSQPQHPDANHNLGVLAVSLNKTDIALQLFKTALEGNSKIEQFWLSYIDALIGQDQFDNAQDVLERAKKQGVDKEKLNLLAKKIFSITQTLNADGKTPSQQQINNLLDHYKNRRFSDAEYLAVSMTEQFPEHQLAWKFLGVLLRQAGRTSEALKANQKAVQLSPQDAIAHFNLGNTLNELGRLDEAEVSYRQAIEFKPDFAEAHINLGNRLKELGSLEKAEVSYRQAIEFKPNFAQAHSNLGGVLQESRRFGEANVSYKQAIALQPDFAETHSALGLTFKELSRLNEAEGSFRQAITLAPEYVEAYSNLGVTLQELGRLDEAEAIYTQAIIVRPDFAEAHHNLGNILNQQGRLGEATASYTKAIEFKPDLDIAYSNLGNTLDQLGKLEKAVSSFQKAFATRTGIRFLGDDMLAPATTSLFFELTNKCNFHCTFCPSDSQTRAIGSMDFELVKRLYEEAADKKINSIVNLHLMGEPTLHPKLIEVLNFGASKNIKTDLVTNGSTLVAKVVPKILDAMYGTITASHMTPTQETYHFRGEVKLPWDRYISNLRLLVREYIKRLAGGVAVKNDIVIRVMATQNTASNVIVTDTLNEARAILKEWNDFVAEVEQELGMSSFKRKDHNADDLLQENRHSSISYQLQHGIKLTFWRANTFANTRLNEDFELETLNETAYCTHPFTDVGVLWNGDVTLCCFDHDGELKVGNVKTSSIETVIQNKAARKLRASMHGHHPLPSVCQTCQAKPVRRQDTPN